MWRFAFALLLTAIVAAPASAAPSNTLTLGMQLEPPGLDPSAAAAAAVSEITYPNIYETLVRLRPDLSIAPFLAQSWTISPDGRVYILHLRRGVRFSNGDPFDARAVKFSLDRARSAGSVNPQKPALEAVQAIDALDLLTVRITLSHPDSFLLSYLGWPAVAMIDARTAENDATAPVGTGPFLFEKWRRGDSVSLIANPHYWGGKPLLSRVVFKFITDPTAAFAAMKSGDVQAFPGYPAPETLAQFKSDPRFAVVIGKTEGETVLAINNRVPPLNNVLVRRAISYALDRKSIIDGAMFGYGDPIGSHYPPQDRGYIDLTGLYPHNVTKARALLAQAGYPNGFALTLKLPPPSYARRGGEIIAAELAQAGIKVQIENIEWAQWLDQVFTRHDFELSIVSHVEPMDFPIYARPDYYFGYNNPAFNALIAQLRGTNDDSQRIVLLHQMQKTLAHDAVNGFLFELPRLGVWDARLKGFHPDEPVPANDLSHVYFEGAVAAGSRTRGSPVILYIISVLFLGAVLFAVLRGGPIYLAGRAASLAVTLIAASFVVFIVIQILPGDPATYMLGLNATPDAVAALHKQFGLDRPFAARFLAWIWGLLHGDFGSSFTYHVSVASLIGERLSVSLPLALLALAFAIVVAFPLGLLAAARPRGWADRLIMTLAQIGIAIPDFWLGILLVIVFSMTLRWFSAGGFPGWDAGFFPALSALVLPAIALALPQAAILIRVLRTTLIETMREPFVRTARAKGLTYSQALRRHALRNALVPVLTIIGLQFPFLVAGAIIIENVFFLPGLGRLVSEAIAQRDLVVVQGVVVVMVFAVVSVSFLIDIAYAIVDPRIRGGRK
jgi:ABC-type dipeptide/oligopeptide/nickel transport system permease component/ABC-type transport system substrate-binding protein